MRRIIELFANLVISNRAVGVIPHRAAKCALPADEARVLPRCAPERVGESSAALFSMLRALEEDGSCRVRSVMCVGRGSVICECAAPGYNAERPFLAHSMAKTVTGLAVGLLWGDGLLDVETPLYTIFPEIEYRDRKFRNITVKHLLNMTAGVSFGEAGSVSETEWLRAYFSSPLSFMPGSEFYYNSMNSYVLARIVSRIGGRSLPRLVAERIFEPLGIKEYYWESSPEGECKGGWGLYLAAESWARIGMLFAYGGRFGGKQVVSEEWIRAAISTRVPVPDSVSPFDYGYHLWLGRESEIIFSGMLGQYVWILPRRELVAVVLSGNDEILAGGAVADILCRYLGSDRAGGDGLIGGRRELRRAESEFFTARRRVLPSAKRRGLSYLPGLRFLGGIPRDWEGVLGEYRFADNAVSAVPLFLRVMQNNLAGSLEAIALRREGSRVFLDLSDGGAQCTLEVGTEDYREGVLNYNGEAYAVRVLGESARDEDGVPVWKLELVFCETPCVRFIKISPDPLGGMRFRFFEEPDMRALDGFEELIRADRRLSFVLSALERKLGKDFIKRGVERGFCPVLTGAAVGQSDFDKVLAREKERREEELRRSAPVESLLDTFIREEPSDGTRVGFIRGFLGGIGNILPDFFT